MNWFIDKAKKQNNVVIVAEEFNEFVKYYPSSNLYSTNQINVSRIDEK
jgi:hypothetical protein